MIYSHCLTGPSDKTIGCHSRWRHWSSVYGIVSWSCSQLTINIDPIFQNGHAIHQDTKQHLWHWTKSCIPSSSPVLTCPWQPKCLLHRDPSRWQDGPRRSDHGLPQSNQSVLIRVETEMGMVMALHLAAVGSSLTPCKTPLRFSSCSYYLCLLWICADRLKKNSVFYSIFNYFPPVWFHWTGHLG